MTPDPAQVDVAELRALLEAATPGPWEARHGEVSRVVGCCTPTDAELSAAARNALPALLDRLVAAEAKVAAVYEVVADQGGRCLNPKCEKPTCLVVGAVCAALEQTP